MDLVDYSKSTPTTLNPRLRIASVNYKASDSFKIKAGKDWVLFDGINPHTYNFVGNNYRSGNTGFIADEIAATYSFSGMDLALGVSQHGRNDSTIKGSNVNSNPPVRTNGSTEAPSEFSTPAVTLRYDYNFENSKLGVAYIIGKSKWSSVNSTLKDKDTNAGKVFGDLKFADLNIRFEYYIGKNVNDLALLGLGNSVASDVETKDKNESGGLISFGYKISDTSHLHAGYGIAQITNKKDSAATDALVDNTSARIGYKKDYEGGFSSIIEFTTFNSKYLNVAGFSETTSRSVSVIELGALFVF